MRTHSLYAYPWDLPGQGAVDVTALREELAGLGIDSLTLAASYHAGKFIAPRRGRVVFPEDGTVYFRPDPARYGRVKPLQAAVVEQRADPFATLAREAGLPVHAWVVLNHNYRLGQLHPDLVVRNVWGDAYPYSLCPCQPAVQEYALALCTDLAGQGLAQSLRIESPGFLTYAHGFHHEFQQLEMNRWLDALLGLCFCARCLAGSQAAGIDSAALRLRVRGWLQRYLDSPVAPTAEMAAQWLLADLVSDPDLAAFVRWRCDQVSALVARIRAALPAAVGLAVIATCQQPHASALFEGMDLAGLARGGATLELPLYQPSAARTEADALDALRRIGPDAAPPRAILRPGPPDMQAPGQLADTLARLQGLGINDFAFYNYGMLRAHDLRALGDVLQRSH